MSRHDLRQEIQKRHWEMNIAVLGIGLTFLAGMMTAALFTLRPPAQADPTPGTEAIVPAIDTGAIVPAEANYSAPELSAKNVYGNTESLNDYRGKVVLVNFWATWCPPCKTEMPMLVAFYNAHVDEGFVIISINARESDYEIANFIRHYKMTFPIWLDPNGDALSAFKNSVLPSSYAIDRMGTVRHIWAGSIDDETLEKYVIPMIQGN
jgi:thiol-disulfide isomerase/thioredoxin